VEPDPRGPRLIFARSWRRSKAIQIPHIRKLSDPETNSSNLASLHFPKQGYTPALPGKRTDVLLRPQGYTLLFECKRPRSHKGLKQSLKKASEQLQREIKRRKTRIFTCGVVALDVSY